MVSQASGSSMGHYVSYGGATLSGNRRDGVRIGWACSVLAMGMLFFLGACSGGGQWRSEHPVTQHEVQPPARVGLILPLSGSNAAIGQRMRDAAHLALPAGGYPDMDVFDSAASGGAARAARNAMNAGDRIVLGPLLARDTEQVADILQPAHVPILAFTSDVEQSRPGVWVMGLTPEQQVRRLVDAAVAEGRQRFAAFLPDNALGHALAEGLVRVCQEAGLEPPRIAFHTDQADSIANGLATLSEASTRQNIVPSDATAEGQSPASPPVAEQTWAPPPFDALLLGDRGLELARVIEAMKADHIDPLVTRVMGPALWKAFDQKLGELRGAWYVAPDERQRRSGYVQRYRAAYRQLPSSITDFAYDAAALAGALIQKNSLNTQTLTRSDGFLGVSGAFRLREDGRVTRALGVYQIQLGGGALLVIPGSQLSPVRKMAAVSGQHSSVAAPVKTLVPSAMKPEP